MNKNAARSQAIPSDLVGRMNKKHQEKNEAYFKTNGASEFLNNV
jgi:hypothetical protein